MSLTYRSDLNRPLTVTEIDNNFRHFTGSHTITGTLTVTTGVVGDLIGTASQATTASYITLAQTASYIQTAQTALQANTASLALVASYVELAQSASYVALAKSASYVALAESASYVSLAKSASYVETAQTASYVSLVQGPGISINGLQISASLRTVNGITPINGNISIALNTTLTGTSASLALTSSGDITGSLAQGTLWIVSGDSTPAKNGTSYIYSNPGVGQWTQVPLTDTSTNDARYLKLDAANGPMAGNLNMGGYTITNVGNITGTASFAATASQAITASYAQTATTASHALQAVSSSYATTASYITTAQTASYINGANVIGSVENARVAVTASYVSSILTLQAADPLPSVVNGGLAVSSSGYLYFGFNNTWKEVHFD